MCSPTVEAVTSTLIVQPPTGMVAPLFRRTSPLPGLATRVPVQVLEAFGVPATSTLPGAVGRVSVKLAVVVIATLLSLSITMVRVEVPAAGISGGLNCLLTVGGCETTRSSVAGSSLLMPSAVLTDEAGITLV